MSINRAVKFVVAAAVVAIYVGCSPVAFEKDNEVHKCQNFAATCIVANGRDHFDESFTVAGGLVDILIVNDNSASMSFEQAHLAERLVNFVANLEAQHADYRIGITTTDISGPGNPARAVNSNGALQDGKLIAFSNGEYFLTPASGSLAQKDQMFKQAIQRPETLACESFIRTNYGQPGYENAYIQNCPSGDERGIYAANLTVKNNPNSFIRPNAHLAIIFLADEDERSQLYYYNQQNPGSFAGYDLEDLDRPEKLISNVAATYGGKALSVHAIVTASESCLATQNNQMVVNGVSVVNGSYGLTYYQASQQTKGIVGDICESDYTARLGKISTNILDRKDERTLACENPADLVVTVTGQTGVTHSVSGRELSFNVRLEPGTTVRYQYSCETL